MLAAFFFSLTQLRLIPLYGERFLEGLALSQRRDGVTVCVISGGSSAGFVPCGLIGLTHGVAYFG